MKERNLLSLSYGRIKRKDINTADGLLPESFETYQVVEPGDIVMRLTDLQNDKRSLRQGLVQERGIVTSAYDALHVSRDDDARFWAYALLALDMAKYYYSLGGGVRQSIKFTDFPNDWIAKPDLDTQKAIADFLDKETARIDQLIEKKQRLVELLGEREKSVPSDLIPSGRMVLQGLLGQSVGNDQQLERTPIKTLFRLAKRQGFQEKTILSVYREHGVVVRNSRDDNINKVPMDVSSYQLVEPGDLVINKMKAWQGSLGISDHEGITSPDYVVMVPTRRMQNRYINHLLRARPMPDFYRAISNGIRPDQWRLEVDRFLATSIYLPSSNEQESIADEIDRLIASHRSLADHVQVSIDRLKEYRSALITAAVTGQIDVTRWGRTGEGNKRLDQIQEEMAG
ncbi:MULTISPECIES: hypothetical protein [Alphaproteobacteria]|uniref:hypothetical protein n=1 Tax=Alphaproteobacteria TaxID=28211 RepID=UPI001B11548A|nr:hypothetical protein [Maricaulis sp.]MBO6765038.1 restriction endonuclease subunit S [Maricaulis sp.]